MELVEHEGKAILQRYGIAVPKGRLARTPVEAAAIAMDLGGACMVKAQVRKGGRGKAGLVKAAPDGSTVARMAADLFGIRTTPLVDAILVERRVPATQELYLSIRVDDVAGMPVILASTRGGVEIEAHRESVASHPVDVLRGLARHEAVAVWKRAGLGGDALQAAAEMTLLLWRAFWESDAELIEVNPLIVDADGKLWAADAKVSIDDNSLYRHPELAAIEAGSFGGMLEQRARRLGVNTFIDLGGDISVMSSGASFGMLLLDRIVAHGGTPANFMDMGGRATGIAREKLCELTVYRAENAGSAHAILIAFVLTSQSLKMITDSVLGAFGGRKPPCPVFAWIGATHVATRDLSRADAYQRLAAAGARTFEELDDAVAAAVEATRS